MNPTRTQAIKTFLNLSTHSDLASLYNHDMEVQVNVAQDGGTRIESDFKGKQWHGWTDGAQVWKSFRIPRNANTIPVYDDVTMSFDLASRVEGIGMTGWDWKSKVSRWVAFDFDALTGHSEKHRKKLTDVELLEIEKAVHNVEWTTLRKSTSGKGLHLYIFLEPTPTQNHNEHAALARAILGKLSALVNFDFHTRVDTCGGNMWIWHRKMRGTDGLVILKSGTILDLVPPNWRDHVKVVTGSRRRNLPRFVETQAEKNPDIEDVFDELTAQRIRVSLDDEHKALIRWLEETYPNAVWWDADHHMLVTHTALLSEAKETLSLRGPFKTNASGTEKGYDHNCFAFPMRKGAWAVRRYTPGVAEDASWDQDGAGWTRCYLNKEPDLHGASKAYEGQEDPAGGYVFQMAEQAQKAALLLGADLKLPNWALGRKAKLKEHKSGRLVAELDRQNEDFHIEGWLGSRGKQTKMFDVKARGPSEPEVISLDDEVRHIISEGGEDLGWVIRGEGDWQDEPYQHVKTYLTSRGFDSKEVSAIMGSSIARAWRIVNKPFQDEYLPNRQWNRGAVQLRYKPSQDRDNLQYSTWLRILSHCGSGLTEAVQRNAWCSSNGITTGSDYLKCWISSLFQNPLEPLPYLFFYGEQDSGKSIFHEAISLLVSRGGVTRADVALSSQSSFNGELEHAIVCIVEETDLRKSQQAYNRIKDWVTSRQLPIHKKSQTPYLVPNTTHWVQAANSHLSCPVFPGDTRITMVRIGQLSNDQKIPKRDMITLLEKEAPDFLAEILNLEIPICPDRLGIPVIATDDKLEAERANQTMLEAFIEEKCHSVQGEMIQFSEFSDRFHEWLDPNSIAEWTKIKIGRELPPAFPKGRLPQTGQFWIGNIAWTPGESTKPKLVVRDGKLVFNIERNGK